MRMVDLNSLQKLLEPLAWFLTLGKTDTEHVRGEISDLLHHTGQSVRTLIEIEQALAGLKEPDFNAATFFDLRLHCEHVYTGNEAAQKSRTHCTDIMRDVERITFKTAQVGRTNLGEWKGVRNAFRELENADVDFLSGFEGVLRKLGTDLREINVLLDNGLRDAAWKRFLELRSEIRKSVESLHEVVDTLSKAENHIRRVLT